MCVCHICLINYLLACLLIYLVTYGVVMMFDNIPVPTNIAGRDSTNSALVVDSCLAALIRANTDLDWSGDAETET